MKNPNRDPNMEADVLAGVQAAILVAIRYMDDFMECENLENFVGITLAAGGLSVALRIAGNHYPDECQSGRKLLEKMKMVGAVWQDKLQKRLDNEQSFGA